MKATLKRDNLLTALNTTLRAVSLKATLPILANVNIATQGSKLLFTSTNLELGLNYWCDATVAQEGSLSVPARVVSEFVNSLTSESVELEVSEENLTIKSNDGEATIAGISSSEFPPVPSLGTEGAIFLDPNEFGRAVSSVAFAASSDTSRAVLNSILLAFNQDSLSLVATDGYRLGQKKWSRETGVAESVIIPAKSLYEISRVVSEVAVEGEELKVYINKEKNQALFGLEKVHMATRLVDGQYPNYAQIIPSSFSARAVVETQALLKATRTASVLARDLGSVIRASFEKDKLTLLSSTTQVGDSKTSVAISYEGEPITVAFNQRFLSEALGAINTSQLTIELNSATQPLLLKGVGDESYLHLIMPVRMQG